MKQSIGEMVAQDYRKAEVFKKFGIDFCCGGKDALDKTCEKKGIELKEVQTALEQLEEKQNNNNIHDFINWELDKLADYITDTHHTYVNEAVLQLDEYSAKVAKVHGHSSPEVVKIAQLYGGVANELRIHMYKEEVVLFSYIKALSNAKRNNIAAPTAPFGTIKNPISMMELEHDTVGRDFEEIRSLSNNYTPPKHACNTYKVLYAKLQEFENDLHVHIHLENNILFPKAIELEIALRG